MCSHVRLHPARIDGCTTVCLDCGHQVSISNMQYANGKAPAVQAQEAWGKLQKISEVAPSACPKYVPLYPEDKP